MGFAAFSVSGNPHDKSSIAARDRGAEILNFGNIVRRRWEITPVCSVICMTYSITNIRIYSASARCDCRGCEIAVSVKNG